MSKELLTKESIGKIYLDQFDGEISIKFIDGVRYVGWCADSNQYLWFYGDGSFSGSQYCGCDLVKEKI